MSTIHSPSVISTILANNGTYPGDPPCYSVLSYINDWGHQTWAITYSQADEQRYFDSPFISAITFLFMNGELTQDGLAHLEQYPPTPGELPMTIECYYGECPYHSSNDDQGEGPFCYEQECRATPKQLKQYAANRTALLKRLHQSTGEKE